MGIQTTVYHMGCFALLCTVAATCREVDLAWTGIGVSQSDDLGHVTCFQQCKPTLPALVLQLAGRVARCKFARRPRMGGDSWVVSKSAQDNLRTASDTPAADRVFFFFFGCASSLPGDGGRPRVQVVVQLAVRAVPYHDQVHQGQVALRYPLRGERQSMTPWNPTCIPAGDRTSFCTFHPSALVRVCSSICAVVHLFAHLCMFAFICASAR